jgi:pSer/pThr/pTyr-binding forkhead associated (FHA) protein
MKEARRKFTIGRERSCDIPLADDSVSGHHAELEFLQDGKVLLTDCQSTNGTFLLGPGGQSRPIHRSLVSPLDQVSFGAVTLGVGELIQALRLKAGIPAPATEEAPRVQGRRLIRCACGGIKTAEAPCPECGQ